jgi:hypothetical protein
MALLVGFVLDQQVSVQKAFSGPLALKERLGSLDAKKLAKADLDPLFREKPAIHRFPGTRSPSTLSRSTTASRRRSGRTHGTPVRCGRTWRDSPASER